MRKKRKEMILALLLLVLALSVTWRLLHPYEQGTVPALKYRADAVQVAREVPVEPGKTGREGVLLSLFLNPPIHPGTALRDPFYEKKAAPVIPAKEMVETPVEKKSPLPPVDPLARVREELQQFKVFGSYEGPGKTGVFLARGKQLLIVRPGDRIDGKYLVEEVSETSMRLFVTALKERVHIDMTRF